MEQVTPSRFRFGCGYTSPLGAPLSLRLDGREITTREPARMSSFVQILSQGL